MKKQNLTTGLAILGAFLAGCSVGATIQEHHDRKGLQEIQTSLEDMVYDLKHKKYVEIKEN